jgi:hypothetical protein
MKSKRTTILLLIAVPMFFFLAAAGIYIRYYHVPFPYFLVHTAPLNGMLTEKDGLIQIDYEPVSSHKSVIKITPDSIVAHKIIAAPGAAEGCQPEIMRIDSARFSCKNLGISYYDELMKLDLLRMAYSRRKDIFRHDTRVTVSVQLRDKKNVFQFQPVKNDDYPYDRIMEYVNAILKKSEFVDTTDW